MFILTIMEASMSTGDHWNTANGYVDYYIQTDAHVIPTEEVMKDQIEQTSNAFATDMLVMKFIQEIPIVGMIGGAMNPVYYNKVMNYVEMKHRKRYLLSEAAL